MFVEHIILALLVILVLSLIAQPISRVLQVPLASILVLLGYIVSELLVYAGIDTGIRSDNFQSIVFYVFIPVLVFESAYNIDKQHLKKNLPVILSLAIIAMLFTCLIVAVLLFYGIGHETGFPWMAALITGAILAATDPVAVVEKLYEMKVSRRITVLLEGESLFNDATAIVLFGLFLSMATAATGVEAAGNFYSVTGIIVHFIVIFIGGVLNGLVVGMTFGFLQKRFNRDVLTGVMSLIVAYGSYLLAEFFNISGVMSTLVAALSFSILSENECKSKEAVAANKYLWDMIAYTAKVSVFIVVGAVITLEMFEQRWLAMIIAIFSLILARAISVYGVLMVFKSMKDLKVSFAEQSLMVWAGLRGAVTLALALSLPTTLDYWWTIQSIAFGVVMFSLFVQAPSMQFLVKRLSV